MLTAQCAGGGVSEKEILKLRAQAEAFFRTKFAQKPAEEVADFGSFCIEQWLKGRDAKTSFIYLAVDYFRSGESGSRSRRGSDVTQRAPRAKDPQEGPTTLDRLVDPRELPGGSSSFAFVRGKLSGKERAVWLLAFEYGFNLKEIGYLFGVTESRVSQWVAGIQARVSGSLRAIENPPSEEAGGYGVEFNEGAADEEAVLSWADSFEADGDFLLE